MTTRIHRFSVLGLLILAAAPIGVAQGTGEATYKAKCQMCHGATGAGDTPTGKMMKVLPFSKGTEADTIAMIKNGKGKMPAYNSKLTDAQIKDVASYIHTSLLK